jgi:hypothetical protein
VKIVDQEDFLGSLLDGAAQRREIPEISVSTTHVSEVGARLQEQPFDFVIAHAHAKPARKLESAGTLIEGRIVFANAHTLIGPRSDPAHVANAADFGDAVARITAHKACWLVNYHSGLQELQERLFGGSTPQACVIDDAANSGPLAMRAAAARGAYTVWGYHPFMRLRLEDMRGFAFNDRFLMRPLKAWVVAGGPRGSDVRAVIDVLVSAEVQQRVSAFRLERDAHTQAWWPAAAAQ